jgi:hypothetical protein
MSDMQRARVLPVLLQSVHVHAKDLNSAIVQKSIPRYDTQKNLQSVALWVKAIHANKQ